MKINGTYEIMTLMGEIIAVDVSNKFHGVVKLNKTSEFIWKDLEKEKGIEEIANHLTEKYDVSYEKAFQSTKEFCEQLVNEGILVE